MRYFVELDPGSAEAPIAVDVSQLPSGALDVRVDGRSITVDVAALGNQLSMLIDGRVVDLTTEGAPPDVGAVASGHRSYVRVESERARAAKAATRGASGGSDKLVKSPMPGRIIKVLVVEGDSVVAGQPLLVVEAMKMENEVKAKSAGVIAKIMVKVGDTVEGSAKLLSFQ